jgi:1-acyl-sn-glycerol-3-phosphate acyltransferase
MARTVKKESNITSTRPKKWKLKIYKIFYILFGPIGRYFLKCKFHNIEINGIEYLQSGPKLLLMNHSCPLDPLIITFFGRQPLQFLITEAFMQKGPLATIASLFGQISKRKLDFDNSSIRLMKQWCDEGAIVAMFPEGQFSWDGSPNPILPGIEQLISYLKVPVVCVNVENGQYVKPAWATFYRKTSIKINIHQPLDPNEMVVTQQLVETQIFKKNEAQYLCEGENLAIGLKKHLRFCPECKADNSLVENNNILNCFECELELKVQTDNMITIVKDNKKTHIKEYIKELESFLDHIWMKDKEIYSLGNCELIDITKAKWVHKDSGKLKMNVESLTVGDTRIGYSDIQALTMDWGDHILFKTRYERFAVHLPSDSRIVFCYLLSKATL